MKLFLYADPHWCQYSSILRRRGDKYSLRLEYEIATINWCQRLAEYEHCDKIICLGDFFDKETLNSEEITALQEIKWSYIPNVWLVGNHDMGINNLQISSSHIFKIINANVIEQPTKTIFTEDPNTEICFLPYILDNRRKSIYDYFGNKSTKRRIILSHNDIAGIQLGKFISKSGFDIEDIENNCDRFINGHLHNGKRLTEKIFNIGNIMGQNFSEDALLYDHSAFIIDTETLRIDVFDNPYAFNFYKFDCAKDEGIMFNGFKQNSIVTFKIRSDQKEVLNEILSHEKNIIEKRIIIESDILSKNEIESNIESLSINHIEEFKKFIVEQYGDSDLVLEELNEVSK